MCLCIRVVGCLHYFMKKRLASRECRSIADIGNEVVLALDARAVLRDVGINSWRYGNLLLKKIDYGMFFFLAHTAENII